MMKKIIVALGSLLLLVSCSSGEEKGTQQILSLADSLYQVGEYDAALRSLDSLNATYPKEVEARKEALVRAREIRLAKSRSDSTLLSIEMMKLGQLADSLYQYFKLVEAPSMPEENVVRYKGYDPSLSQPQGTYLDSYVTSDGQLELIAATSSPKTYRGVAFLKLSESVDDTYVMSDTLQYDGGLNYRFSDLGQYYERLTFSGDRAKPLASFIANAPAKATLKVDFCSSGGRVVATFRPNEREKEAIGESYRYAMILERLQQISGELSKHDRRLELNTLRDMRDRVPNLE